jgi:competence protein ComEC
LEKRGKKSSSSLVRWILGLVIVLLIFGVINTGKDDPSDGQSVQQIGEEDLTETQVRAEETGSDQASRLAENNPEDENSVENNFEDKNPADSNLSKNASKYVNSADENLTVNFLDVVQGDSILLEYNGKSMLIDAGEQDQGPEVSAYLREHNLSSLNYVVATHPHSDHIGGMAEILNEFQVQHFIDSGFPHSSKTYENMLTIIDENNIPFEVAKRGEEIEFDPAIEVEILNPGSEYSDKLNENSVVLKISYGEVSFLFMGDAGLETEEKLMDAGYDLNSEILKVGHHASRSGSGERFVSLVNPEVSIIEVGAGNDYGHPHAEVLKRLQKTSRVFRTDLDGTIAVTTDGSTYAVTAQKTSSDGEKENITKKEDITKTESEEVKSENGNEEIGLEDAEIEESVSQGPAEPTIYVSELSLQDEWVELTNNGFSPVSLENWKIEDEGSKHTYTFPSRTLDSRASVTLYTGEGMDTATEIYWGSGSPIWNNDGDTAYLYDDSGKQVAILER